MAMAASSTSTKKSLRWADLPMEMVDEVVGHLDIFSAAQLTAVCTSWAKAVATKTSLPFGARPCLLMSRDGDDQREFGRDYSGEVDEHTFQLLDLSSAGTWREIAAFPASIGAVRDRWWVGAKGDWLATVDERCNAQIVNPYTGDQIDLPAITTISGVELTGRCCEVRRRGHGGYVLTLRRIVVCETPSTGAAGNDGGGGYLVIGVFTGALLAIARGGDRSWTALKNPRETWFNYLDAIVHKGKVFAVGSDGSIYAWDLAVGGACTEPETVPVPAPPEVDHDCKYPQNLAESADGRRLLLVCTQDWAYMFNSKLSQEIDMFDDHGLHLYELDVDGDGWSRVTSLGDSSLFLGANYPFMASVDRGAPEGLLQPNCVYFTINELFGYLGMDFDLVAFDLDSQKHQKIRLFYSNRYFTFQAPIWFRPTTVVSTQPN